MVDEKSTNAAANESSEQHANVARLNELSAQKKRLTELYINGFVNMDEYKQENERIERKIDEAKGNTRAYAERNEGVGATASYTTAPAPTPVPTPAHVRSYSPVQQEKKKEKKEPKEKPEDISLENLRIRYAPHNRYKLEAYLLNKKAGVVYDDAKYFGYVEDEFSKQRSTAGDTQQNLPSDSNQGGAVNNGEAVNLSTETNVASTSSSASTGVNHTNVQGVVGGAANVPYVPIKPKRPKYRLACDIVALVTMLLVILFTFTCYATPTVEIGGEVYREKTMGIGRFSWRGEDSIRAQFNDEILSFKDAIENMNGSDVDEEAALTITSAFTKVIRLIFLGIPSMFVYISSFAYIIFGIVWFCLKRSKRLISCCVSSIANVAFINAMFAFFGSISDGVGDAEYYIGYTVGFMARFVAGLGIVALVTVSIISYACSKRYKIEKERKNWNLMLVASICAILMIPLISSARLYTVFTGFMSSILTSSVASLAGSFSFKSLLYPALNFIVFVGFSSLYSTVLKVFNTSTVYIAGSGDIEVEKEPKSAALKKLAQKQKEKGTSSKVLVAPIVLSCIAIVAIILLKIPSIGFGWSVNLLVKAILLLFIASIGQTVLSVLATPVATKKKEEAIAVKPQDTAAQPDHNEKEEAPANSETISDTAAQLDHNEKEEAPANSETISDTAAQPDHDKKEEAPTKSETISDVSVADTNSCNDDQIAENTVENVSEQVPQ